MGGESARLHAIVRGDVQGVGYRVFVQRLALPLGIRGWVRNRMDGSVEVVAEGQRPALEELLRDLQAGPRGARVVQVEADWREESREFTDFRIRHL